MPEPYTPDGSKVTYTVPSLDDPADGPQAFRDFADSIPPGLSAAIPIRIKTADYTLALDDEGAGVFFDTTTESHRVTVPAHSSVAFPVGTAIVIGNVGTNKEGNVQITPADGVTVRDTAVRKVGLNRMAVLLQVEQDSWIINAGTGGGPAPGSVPSPPKLTAAIGGPECAYLNWEAPKDDGGHDLTTYTVERSTNGTDWTLCATELPPTTSTRVDNLTTGTKYQFRVKAGNVIGFSDPSNVLEATPTNAYNDATGGTVKTFTKEGRTYRSHSFTGGTGTLTINKASVPFEVLIVAGGGGGGGAGNYSGSGGGGAGGVIRKQLTLPTGVVNVKVGAGSSGRGEDSVLGDYTAVGGGNGGGVNGNGTNGGSGGGGGGKHDDRQGQGGSGTSGQGNAGSAGGGGAQYQPGGGGGGAGAAGGVSNGGDGVPFSYIDGTERWYGGGGGGGGAQYGAGGAGGKGGGGRGGQVGTAPGQAGEPNTGGGGGGGSGSNGPVIGPGPGGSGIVVVAYEIAPSNDVEGGETSVYSKDGKFYRVHTFKSSAAMKVNNSSKPFRIVIVGGGGGSGMGKDGGDGSGRGGSGYHYTNDNLFLETGTYAVTVGNRGGGNKQRTGCGQPSIGGTGGKSSVERVTEVNGGTGGGNSGTGGYINCGAVQEGVGGPSFTSDITGTNVTYAVVAGTIYGSGGTPEGGDGVGGVVLLSYEIPAPTETEPLIPLSHWRDLQEMGEV